ncbi:kinesin-1 [Tieghemostelium lacteum]|uniref:Kinesin-like protein n=1 Tax=Tieghemostelium lacteum TaxID=361077 RepID=A0A151Z9E1_TIELA|nr:kinesin-1 [Tieghemostelium lacteum]|eukprot:KYQ90484.1 kinesin-1 [Tieghemostelium lacteum]
MSSTTCNIRVIARFRPLNDREKQMKENKNVLAFPDENSVVVEKNPPFTFDRVFPPESTQDEVFEYVEDTITDVLGGFNTTIFCYGQTGSGKSHTMFGSGDKSDTAGWGIIPRSNLLMFSTIDQQDQIGEISIKCSFLEIYMENIQDLLNPKKDPKTIKIRESKTLGIYVEGLEEEYVQDENDIMELIAIGESSRSVAKTNMNQKSSRSHSILIIQIEQKSPDGSVKRGKLNLVDLAGSEKVSKTGAEGQTLEEAKKINQSLSLLGNCIHALTDSKREHIPFRDSKLTRLLQDSLGGNTKTTLIITGSPHYSNVDETLSTLKFGSRAKTIKNTVKVNQQKSAAELQAIVNALSKELSSLKLYSIGLENLVNYFKSPEYVPGNPIPKSLEIKKIEFAETTTTNPQNALTTPKAKTQRYSTAMPSSPVGGSGQANPNGTGNPNRHSIAITTTPPPNSSTSVSNGSGSHSSHHRSISNSGGGMKTSVSHDNLNLSGSSTSSLGGSGVVTPVGESSDNLFDPLKIIELEMEIEKIKEDNLNLIDKFKDEMSDLTIKYESACEELAQQKLSFKTLSDQATLDRQQLQKEQSTLAELERNQQISQQQRDLKMKRYIQNIEDLKLLANQLIQYLERKRSVDYFDSGSATPNLQMLSMSDQDEDINVEDILRSLSEEEVLSMQLKLQLQNKCEQLEQNILILERELQTIQQQQVTKQDQVEVNIDSTNITPESNTISNSSNSSLSISSPLLGGDRKVLQKEVDDIKLLNQDLNIKNVLYQNQISNLQNDLVSLQNKLQNEKKQVQQSLEQQQDLTNKLNQYIKESENNIQDLTNENTNLSNDNAKLQQSYASLELQAQDLQDQLTSTQRLLANRKVVKVIRGDEKSMKRAYELKVDFGQQFLKKTGRSLF